MPNPNPHVLIAGGGIGGLVAAITLARGGAEVDVFERAAEFSEIGAGIQCSANAMHVLNALGLRDELRQAGFEPERAVLRDGRTAVAEMIAPLKGEHDARYGQPYLHVHRADLHKVMFSEAMAAGVRFHLNEAVRDYENEGHGVKVLTSRGFQKGGILIGADGIHSAVRQSMLGDIEPQFTGQTVWRALIPATSDIKKIVPPDATVWMGNDRHVVTYYVSEGAFVNVVAVIERRKWSAQNWVQDGNSDDLRTAFKKFDPWVKTLLNEVDQCGYWGLFTHPRLPKWTDQSVALLGDAAHPMLPFLAQGGAMAIEDAWVLSHHILRGAWLGDYEAARKARAETIQRRSANQAKLYHAFGLGKAIRRFKLELAGVFPALQYSQLDPIYGVNVVKDYPIAL